MGGLTHILGERLLANSYTKWAPGEDGTNILHWAQDCVVLDSDHGGQWFDITCNTWPAYYGYICQYGMCWAIRKYSANSVIATLW